MQHIDLLRIDQLQHLSRDEEEKKLFQLRVQLSGHKFQRMQYNYKGNLPLPCMACRCSQPALRSHSAYNYKPIMDTLRITQIDHKP